MIEILLAILICLSICQAILLKEVEENIEDVIHVLLFKKSKKFKEVNP